MASDKTEKFRLSYNFLVEKERTGVPFDKDEASERIGWAPSTVKTYITKKWEQFLTREGHHYYVSGVSEYTLEEYCRLMSQKDSLSNEPKRPMIEPDVERLIIKAREAAIHGLDSYNRPLTIFRAEGLIVMMVIAWRSLFHAIFQKRRVDYFYSQKDGTPEIIDGEEKAWDLSECLKKYFGNSTTPVRKNLEFIIGLRNRIEHRYVPALDMHVAGECQALVLNFDDLLIQQFSDYYALRESLVFPIQTTGLRTAEQMDIIKRFQGKQYDDLKDYIDTFRDALSDAIYQDPRYSFRVYMIPKIGNHASSSDLAFEYVKYDPSNPEAMAALEKQVALIRERKVQVANAGKYKPSQVAKIVSDKIGRPFAVQHHTRAWKIYDVRKSGEEPEGCNTRYCQFDDVHRDHVYTEEWVDFLVMKLGDEKEYIRVTQYKG